jgi:hypothetical protein
MDELLLSLQAMHPKVAAQVATFLHERLGQCEIAGCIHPVIKDDAYSCHYCSTIDVKRYFCLAEHCQLVDLRTRYSEHFQEDEWLWPTAYLCSKCVFALDLRFLEYCIEGGFV